MRWIIPALIIAAAALAANVTYVMTPSGDMYIEKSEIEIKGYAANAQELVEMLKALARQLAPVDNATASTLLQISDSISDTAARLKAVQDGLEIKVEYNIVQNGKKIEVEYKNGKFEIEIKRGGDKKEGRGAAGGKQKKKRR